MQSAPCTLSVLKKNKFDWESLLAFPISAERHFMEIFYPGYYHDFHCLAGRCPDSCCKEWTVDVDPEAAARYRALPGALGDRLRQVLTDSGDGWVMTIENGRCPMWRNDGLCRIQAELGHDALCKTCRDFPRLQHDYGDFAELGLELSCPEAARLILTSPNREFLTGSAPGGDTPEYDLSAMANLRGSRQAVLDFLAKGHPIPETLAAILLYAHDVQAELDGGEPVAPCPEACLSEVRGHTGSGNMASIFAFFQGLEILTDTWKTRLTQPPVSIRWTEQLRALARYMIERYWLQAVSDYDLVGRVKLAITACLLVGALGGDVVETAQLFSKEIENDPDNIEAILDGAYTSSALTDANLLALLLG